MKDELKYKIPTEIFDFFRTEGVNIDEKYMFIPFWIEVIDRDNGIVKMHHLSDLPDRLQELMDFLKQHKL